MTPKLQGGIISVFHVVAEINLECLFCSPTENSSQNEDLAICWRGQQQTNEQWSLLGNTIINVSLFQLQESVSKAT